jgi:type I restriction enzyme M protein
VNDGSLLFVQHMISKFEPVLPHKDQHGSRMAVVLSGSPLFTGGAGSGESDIRKWIIESDWLEAIIALPEQMFYNTGIGTYIWIITNRKEKRRKGKIQLLDARSFWQPGGSEENRRSLGDKRRHISTEQIDQILQLYDRPADGEHSKTFDNADFGYTRVTVERPLRLRYQMSVDAKGRFLDACPHLLHDVQEIDKQLGREPRMDWNEVSTEIQGILRARKSRWKAGEEKLFRNTFTTRDSAAESVIADKPTLFNIDLTLAALGRKDSNRGSFPRGPKGTSLVVRYEADPDLRDFENVPLKEDIDAYFEREVLPHVPDAWMDRSKNKVGYEINFNRYFYKFTPPRELAEIDAEIEQAEKEFMRLFKEVTKA